MMYIYQLLSTYFSIDNRTAVLSQKAVTAHFLREQLLPFGFTE